MGCLLESGVSAQLPTDVRPELQRHISSLILATDITRQQEFLTRFRVHLFTLIFFRLSILIITFPYLLCCRII